MNGGLNTADARRTADSLRGLGLAAPDAARSGLLERLRRLVPTRPLAWREAEQLAERQADRLRSELGVLGPRLDEEALDELTWLTVTRREGFPTSGMATKTDLGWVVVLKADEPRVRQRFSLAHEIKHTLDDDAMQTLRGDLYPATAGYSAEERGERVADRFAAALLMPRRLLRADWTDGIQDIAALAKRYGVSRAAMTVRVSQLGLTEPTKRCSDPRSPGGSA